MIDDKFEIEYAIDDGYAGKSRPQYITISSDEIEEDMDLLDCESIFHDSIQDDFEQRILPFGKNKEEFLAWAKKVIDQKQNPDNLDESRGSE